jgi:2-polyprenyl-3-methyl-5-hydroxy-6-metoxy-1,4-benzoquinol methylase
MSKEYIQLNQLAWDEKTKLHVVSDFYRHDEFLKGATSLQSIELELLGNLQGKHILHLQCHFGQDTLSMARMGATVTGVDFSNEAIQVARQTASQLQLEANFVCCDLYEAPQHLKGQFDIVYTSYGTVGWLPDLEKWAAVVAHFLKPGGEFYIIDFHPVLWMFDNEFSYMQYSYFNKMDIVETLDGTYADKNAPIQTKTITWNHSLSDIIQNLLKQGLKLDVFKEYDYSPYDCFANTIKINENHFQIKGLEEKIPMVYAIKASKV